MDPHLSYAATGGLAHIVIANPTRMNAMTYEMWAALPDLVARAAADRQVRAIVLQGQGDKAFCAGADISQFGEKRSGEDAVAAYDRAVGAGMDAVETAEKPTVAVIRGVAFGGGCALALACDLRVARADARFRIPAVRLGLGYGFANIRMLIGKIGMAAVADILLTARVTPAEEALRLGLAQRVFAAESFEDDVAAFLATLGGAAPLTLAAIKRAFVELARPEAEQDEEAVARLIARCFASADYKEGQAAFREKRDPVFRGE